MHISEMTIKAFNNSERKGFHKGAENQNIPTKLALIHAEVSEALEDYRDGKIATTFDENGKPHGFAQELADIVIRVGDLAEMTGVNLEAEVIMKMRYNSTRKIMHGGKKF
jgi:NTP pyrophosphatase (non-canonical NTP hydrolase)